MNIVSDIKSLSSFKQKTADIIRQVEDTKRPVVVTVNGEAKFVIQDAVSYQKTVDYVKSMTDTSKIAKALKEAEEGQCVPVEQVFSNIKKKYNLV